MQPHRQKHHRFAASFDYKLSTDPFIIEKVRDMVGLYLNPPANVVLLWVDEKTQIQAFDRTQPLLPMGLGYVEGVLWTTTACTTTPRPRPGGRSGLGSTCMTHPPTCWLNQAGRWFRIITQKAIRHGSVKEPISKIEHFAEAYHNTKETLENPADPRDNSLVIAGYGWVHGRQAARIR